MKTRKSVIAFSAVVFLFAGTAWSSPPLKLSNAGDSISQGFSANGGLGDHPELSWVRGTDASVDSVFSRYQSVNASFTEEPESVSGAELVGGGDNFAAQASRICGQADRPNRVMVLLGGNDVCNRPASSSDDATANMYSVDTWVNALRAGLDQLAACLPAGSAVHVVSAPRVDYLYTAGTQKSGWCATGVWPLANICRIVTAETDASRRQQVGVRVNEYNEATLSEVQAYTKNTNGKNPSGIAFTTDWRGSIESGHEKTSVGTFPIGAGDINGTDCFHPNTACQAKLACAGWTLGPDGDGNASSCF